MITSVMYVVDSRKLSDQCMLKLITLCVARLRCNASGQHHPLDLKALGFTQLTTQRDNMYNNLSLYHKILVDVFLTTAIIGFVMLTIETFFRD